MNKRLFRVHPVMLPFFLFFYLSGEVAMYAIVFGSLLVHEAGHLLAAKLARASVTSCTILPYGGEIRMEQFSKLKRKKQLIIILAGPVFTFLLWSVGNLIDFPQKEFFLMTQQFILYVNLLPIYPLDGGRVILTLFKAKYEVIIGLSLLGSFLIFGVSLLYFPQAISISFLFLFLVFQNNAYWKFRRYKLAFDYITKSA